MTTINHTPGPWEHRAVDLVRRVILAPHELERLPLIAVVSTGAAQPHGEANTQLIASATTAPHHCTDTECPGNQVLAFLNAFVATVEAHQYKEIDEPTDYLRQAAAFIEDMGSAKDSARAILELLGYPILELMGYPTADQLRAEYGKEVR